MAPSCRTCTKAVARRLGNHVTARTYRTSSSLLAAHNFTMPALSPTMTEGNIATWKVKEGDSFLAGDVLLEVETDKAQMDVEAQDDGIMAKIMVKDGAKTVAVGTRIGVIADPDDDLKTLKIPSDEAASKKVVLPQKDARTDSEPPAPKPIESKETSSKATEAQSKGVGSVASHSSNKPLNAFYPAVQVLLHKHNLDAKDIPATGPNNRLLKGDVLAHLKKIPLTYIKQAESRIKKLNHLDLSNIKPATPTKPAPQKPAEQAAKRNEDKKKHEEDIPIAITVPISLSAVLQVQKRMQDSLGISLPLSTFITRAIALANENLPVAGKKAPTADELFNSIIGLDKLATKKHVKDGSYSPRIVALPSASASAGRGVAPKKKVANESKDLFDDLVGVRKSTAPVAKRKRDVGVVGSDNLFSVSVGKAEEKRAKVFLERVKTVLEVEPGRLVL